MAGWQTHVEMWLHEGFRPEHIEFYDFRDGFGVRLSVQGGAAFVVFGHDAVPLADQEDAARKAARVFTQVADALAAMRAGEVPALPVGGER